MTGGVSGHLTIHDNAVVYAQSGVGHDVPPGTIISGSPAFDYREWRRSALAFPKLGELVRLVRQLEGPYRRIREEQGRRMSESGYRPPLSYKRP